MAGPARLQQFILLPPRGLRGAGLQASALVAAPAMLRMLPPRILDEVREDGPKLVEVTVEERQVLRLYHPGVRLVPIRYFTPALAPRPAVSAREAPRGAATARVILGVVSRAAGSAVAGADVIAFTSFARRTGAEGKTNAEGEASLVLPATAKLVERLYVFPARGFWSLLVKDLSLAERMEVALAPLDLAAKDALRHYYASAGDQAGAGVTVGVIDTGVDLSHADLLVAGGRNTVVGEKPADYFDNGEGHGTHVAGIIAARGVPPLGLRGLAPGVALRSYRVFGKGSNQASNYAILKALDAAVADRCDLVNMSLGGGEADDATREAIAEARGHGTLVIVAAGNDGRGPVSFPASDSLALGVSALGRVGTFPADATEADFVAAPRGKDKKSFVASFSNVGPELDLIGPGVAILSTFPAGYAALSGTSMACPAVTGAAARVLAAHPEILAARRDQERSDAMARALLGAARPVGFGPTFEGQGLPRIS